MAGFQDLSGSFAPAGNIGKPLTAFEARLTSNAPTAPGLESATAEQSGQVNVMNPWIGSRSQSISLTNTIGSYRGHYPVSPTNLPRNQRTPVIGHAARGTSVMFTRYAAICMGALLGAMALQNGSAQALTMQECSAKYKAAKDAGTLNGMKWNDFRKAECGATATAAPATAPAPVPAPSAAPSTGFVGNAVFPNAVSSRYANESAGKARMHTCLDQYRANKANNGNGGLRWIQKGGGYYSECNKHLKGQA